MKTPEQIKFGLLCLWTDSSCNNCAYYEHGCVDNVQKDALQYIEQLEAKIPKWISVKERLPDVKTPVLTLGRKGSIGIGFITVPDAHIDGNTYFYPRYGDYRPTHWMPLPEELKGGIK